MTAAEGGHPPVPLESALVELRRRRGWAPDAELGPPVPEGETDEDRDARLAAAAAARLARARRYMRVEFHAAAIERVDHPTRRALRVWWESEGAVLVLHGGNGAGKSYASAALLNLRFAAGDRVAWTTTATYCALLMPDPADPDPGHVSDVGGADFTVVDDLGAEGDSPGRWDRLTELFDLRRGDQLRTLITSNLDQPGVLARYGPRLASRVGEDWLQMDAADRRLRGYRAARTV